MKKILVLFVFILLIAGTVGYLLMNSNGPLSIDSSDESPFPSPVFPDRTGTSTVSPSGQQMPGNDDPRLSTAALSQERFEHLKTVWDTFDFEGNLVGTSTNDYSISYTRQFDLIQIGIVSEPAEEVQKTAERVLLDALGMSEEEVCRLNVEVGWDSWSTDFKPVERSLTFCN